MVNHTKSKNGTLPNLVIIGAMKCGTSILHYYLDHHPEIRMSAEKELDFFVLEKNWKKGDRWYESNFDGQAKICGEASPNYTSYPTFQGVAQRMRGLIPDAKLIYILRDPIDRIVSHYSHVVKNGREKRGLVEALENLEQNPYVERSRYHLQLEQYLRHYPLERILIVTQEDLYHERRQTLERIFRFLGVDPAFQDKEFEVVKPSTRPFETSILKTIRMTRLHTLFPRRIRWKVRDLILAPLSWKMEHPPLDESLRVRLAHYLKEDVTRLRQVTGCDFKNWSI